MRRTAQRHAESGILQPTENAPARPRWWSRLLDGPHQWGSLDATVGRYGVQRDRLIVYPPGTAGTFNCMGVPGNCPDHAGVIAGLANSKEPLVYTDASAVPGHDHLVGMPRTGDFNVAWRVFVELFKPGVTVTHITTLAQLKAAWSANSLDEVDTGITFVCSVVSEHAYLAGTPVA